MSSNEGNLPLLEESARAREGIENIAIRVSNLSKCYEIYDSPRARLKQILVPPLQRIIGQRPKQYFREFWALKDVSFEVEKGETVGIIGRNGSGKSTLLQLICSILAPTSGAIEVNGRVGALLELGAGFNPDFTGRENVYMNAAILGFSKKQVDAKFQQIAEFAEIAEFMDQPVKTYSSGMFVRLAFAVQVCVEPDVLIVDEALAVGDVFFRQKCYARLEQLRSSGVAILLVSHSMPDIEQYCERAILLDSGTPLFIGPASEASKHYYLINQGKRIKAPYQTQMTLNPQRDILINTAIRRPSPEAFFDISRKSQVSNGRVRCTGVALSNLNGEPCRVFHQGEMAVFHYEFEVNEDIGVPICGVVISNEKGVIVHGKNSWQYEDDTLLQVESRCKLICQQEIQLCVAPGEYTMEIGLTCVPVSIWENREQISHEESSFLHERLCHIPNVGQFSVGLALKAGVSVLTHHGIADLPGKISIRRELYV